MLILHGPKHQNTPMKNLTYVTALLSLVFLPTTKAIQFDISSVPGSAVRFTGLPAGHSEITFDLGLSGHMFQIDQVVGGTGSANGYQGNLTGIFDMGPVTTIVLVPLVETAVVSGSGTFSIFDGVDTLTATLSLTDAASLKTGMTQSVLGLTGILTALSYTGIDPDLLDFAAGIDRTVDFSFTFPPPGKSLAELTTPGSTATTFSGNTVASIFGVPDSGSTMALLGGGLAAIAAIRRRTS